MKYQATAKRRNFYCYFIYLDVVGTPTLIYLCFDTNNGFCCGNGYYQRRQREYFSEHQRRENLMKQISPQKKHFIVTVFALLIVVGTPAHIWPGCIPDNGV